MVFRLLIIYILKVFFVLSFISCTFLGNHLEDEVFQSEEEEYYTNQLSEDQQQDSSEIEVIAEEKSADSDILGGLFSDEDENVNEDNLFNDFAVNNESSLPIEEKQSKKKKWIPLKKIPIKPWKQSGRWINAVYIARPADNLNQISMLLFSQDKTEELKEANPFLKRRDLKVGDKVYYNSPNRPQDGQNFYHYYQDNNKIAQTYDLNTGDNIRTISQRLLGHKDSWKEIWTTNPQVESKGMIQEPITIQYWIADNAPTMIENEPVATSETTMPLEETLVDLNDELSISADTDGNNTPTDEPIGEQPFADDVMDENMNDPKAPLDSMMAGDQTDKQNLWGSNQVKIVCLVIVLIIIALLLSKIIRDRKNRSDFDFSQTHIDIDNLEE